jgi:hypothetical protein
VASIKQTGDANSAIEFGSTLDSANAGSYLEKTQVVELQTGIGATDRFMNLF